jgi:hypothetical protein
MGENTQSPNRHPPLAPPLSHFVGEALPARYFITTLPYCWLDPIYFSIEPRWIKPEEWLLDCTCANRRGAAHCSATLVGSQRGLHRPMLNCFRLWSSRLW